MVRQAPFLTGWREERLTLGGQRRQSNCHAVDLYALIGRDQEILPPVDDPRLNNITAFRVDSDRGVRGLYLKVFAVDDVLRIQNSAVAELRTALCLKGSDLGVRDPSPDSEQRRRRTAHRIVPQRQRPGCPRPRSPSVWWQPPGRKLSAVPGLCSPYAARFCRGAAHALPARLPY